MPAKKDFRDKAKSIWLRGMKAIGNTAASIANNTRYKVDEVTIQNRRREVMNDLAVKAYALWLKGESFPDQMVKMLEELEKLDEQLNDMRAEKYASGHKSGLSYGTAGETEPEDGGVTQPEDTEEEDESPAVIPDSDSSVSTEINGLFDGTTTVGKAAEKVNSTLDQMSDRLNSFPQGKENKENE